MERCRTVRRDPGERGSSLGSRSRHAVAEAGREARSGRRARHSNAGQSRRSRAPADARDRGRRTLVGSGASGSATRTPLDDADGYYELLRPLCGKVDIWRTTYYHPMRDGAAGIVEWFKGSGLRPFLEPLDAASRAAYLERYTAAVALVYPPLADGSVLLPFPRLSWWRSASRLGRQGRPVRA